MTSRLPFASAVLAVICAGHAFAAEPGCSAARYVTGGTVYVDITGTGDLPTSISGTVELSTTRVAPPLGLRDGALLWDTSNPEVAARGGMLGVNFRVNLPLSEMPQWSTAEGMVVPVSLNFLLPALRDPTGAQPRIQSVTLISGNGIYNSINNWGFRGNESALLISNTPDPATDIYYRELLQLFSNDPSEPITLFLKPGIPGGTDSIASFHAGGILEAPGVVRALLDEYAATGACPQAQPIAATP